MRPETNQQNQDGPFLLSSSNDVLPGAAIQECSDVDYITKLPGTFVVNQSYYNQQQHLGFPINMINQASPNAAGAPWPELLINNK